MKPKSQTKQLWVVLLIVFLGFLGISMPYLIFPALFLNPTYSILPANLDHSIHAILLGITLAAYPLGQFIGSPILGALSDEYGRKHLIVWSLVIAAFCNWLTGFALEWKNLSLVIFSRFAAGLMEGNIAIARAMAADLKSISKHKTFGKINAAASIAFLIGPFIGGVLTEDDLFQGFTFSTPFYFIGLLFILLSIISTLMLDGDQVNRHKRLEWADLLRNFKLTKRLTKLFENKELRFLMIVSTCFTLAVDIFYEFGPVYLTEKWFIGPLQLMWYNAMLCLGLAVGNGWLASYSVKKISSRVGIIGSIGALAVLLIGTTIINHSALMMIFFCLIGLVVGLGVTLLTVRISDSVSDTIQGEVMGVQLSLRVLGDAVICLLGGILLILSSKLILILAAIVSLVIMAFFSIQEKRFTKSP
ncbi:MAG: MFS transporter [Parachlamydiaceae bacterium]|nr:MFS transporter [Parachlamydiaceae bacterium]